MKLKKPQIKELEKISAAINVVLESLLSIIEDLTDEEENAFGEALDEVHGSLEEAQIKVNQFLGVFE